MSDAERKALHALVTACEPILAYLDEVLAADAIGGPRREDVAALREAVAAAKSITERDEQELRFISWWPELNRALDQRDEAGAVYTLARDLYEEGLEPRQAADRIVAERKKVREK